MRFYCPHCGMEYKTPVGGQPSPVFRLPVVCLFCQTEVTPVEIPPHETVAQWEKRNSRIYPISAPVYYSYADELHWGCDSYGWYMSLPPNEALTPPYVATEIGPPPSLSEDRCPAGAIGFDALEALREVFLNESNDLFHRIDAWSDYQKFGGTEYADYISRLLAERTLPPAPANKS